MRTSPCPIHRVIQKTIPQLQSTVIIPQVTVTVTIQDLIVVTQVVIVIVHLVMNQGKII
ncbi:hypothetical protein KPE71_14105 [Acinetobacter soli]|uniref:hypothetical protein n=1 Tax=Acinetobacter soli TaxID=487316 RepID=UPI001C0D33EB|nr:hypothetical protein [Acinetobacter soli]MBU3121386.1 hypothetical protein [Acinetobacter soli]